MIESVKEYLMLSFKKKAQINILGELGCNPLFVMLSGGVTPKPLCCKSFVQVINKELKQTLPRPTGEG